MFRGIEGVYGLVEQCEQVRLYVRGKVGASESLILSDT